MQNLTAAPRDTLTEAQVRSLLAGGPQVSVSQGCDLLDATNTVIDDLTDDMVEGGQVSGNDTGSGEDMNTRCQISLMRELAWGRDRVRPWVELSDGTVTARFYQGVYVLTAPQQPSGETPTTYDVQGYDLTSLLADQIGDSWVVTAGTTYLQALRSVVSASGAGATLLLDGTAQAAAVPYTMVWAMYDGGPSWLSVCNDLLSVIGYERLWADEVGNLRSGPLVASASKPVGWTFDARAGSVSDIVAPGWTRDENLWSAPNKWIFIRTNTNGVSPTVANGGVYVVTNQSDGPSSITSVGRTRPKVVYLDVPDAATLVTKGELTVAADKAKGTKVTFSTFLPVVGPGSVAQFVSADRTEKLPAASWATNLDGSNASWILAEPAVSAADPLSVSGAGTVTQVSPLRVVMDGANADSPAVSLDGAAYALGARVTLTVRNPVPPLVQGVESTT